jgi:hypothetical protein
MVQWRVVMSVVQSEIPTDTRTVAVKVVQWVVNLV